MANTIIVSGGLVTTGDASGNLFVFASGAADKSTVLGGAGKDTIDLNSGESAVGALDVNLKGGQDTVDISATELSGSVIKLGAGADTLTFTGNSGVLDSVYGGDGDDVVAISGQIDVSILNLGGGSDIVSGSDAVSASGASLKMGAGNDTIVLSAAEAASATLYGGGGADSITLDVAAASTAITIAGDADGVVGKDTITIQNTAILVDEINLQGAGGADVIKFDASAGSIGSTGKILGNYGGDNIDISALFVGAGGLTIGGGAGSDTITLDEFGSAGSGAYAIGGGGADSISLVTNNGGTAGDATTSAGRGMGTIIGGAGADSITFVGDVSDISVAAGVIAISSVSDSTEDAMDIVRFTAGATNAGLFFNLEMADGVAGNAMNGDKGLRLSAGTVDSAGGTNFGDMISATDELVATTGKAAVFVHSGDAYLFVQGGSTDMLVRVDSQDTYSAGSVVFSAAASGDFKLVLTSN